MFGRKQRSKPVQTLTETQFKSQSRADEYRRSKQLKDHENRRDIVVLWAIPTLLIFAVGVYCFVQVCFLHNWEQFSSYAIAAVTGLASFFTGKNVGKK